MTSVTGAGFSVDEAALMGAAEQLTTLRSVIEPAEAYVTEYVGLYGWGGGAGDSGIFVNAINTLNSARELVTSELDHLRDLATASAGELRASADTYWRTDNAVDAQHDALYNSASAASVASTVVGPTEPFLPAMSAGALRAEPESALVEPEPEEVIPEFAEMLWGFPEFVSPSYWMQQILTLVGLDIPGWVAENFSGDWERMSIAASALEHLAEYHELFGTGIGEVRSTFEAGWEGQARDAASLYFITFADDLTAQAEPLREMADAVNLVAQGMHSLQKSLEGLLNYLLDLVICAAASGAAAGATAWTGVGGIIGGVATALVVANIVMTWTEALKIPAMAEIAINGFIGTMAGYLGAFESFSMHPLPAGAYDNRLVNG